MTLIVRWAPIIFFWVSCKADERWDEIMRVPWPPHISSQPWSNVFVNWWLKKNGAISICCEDSGVRNHIWHIAVLVE